MATIEFFKKDKALLFEVGLIAIRQGDEEGAKKIFNALALLDDSSYMNKAGYGLIALHKMHLEEAETYFQEILEKDNTNWCVASFLSLTHMLIVLQQGKSFDVRRDSLERSFNLAQQILQECEVESTRQFAQSLLDWHRTLAEKSTGPLG